jgi:hypothetical protein
VELYFSPLFLEACGVAAIIGGLLVGFSNNTLSIDAEEDDDYEGGEVRWVDFLLTTPATLVLYYGILLLSITSCGCFAAAGGRLGCNLIVSSIIQSN